MMYHIKRWLVILAALITVGCSGTEHAQLEKSTYIPKSKAIAVFNIYWVEEYTDPSDQSFVTTKSYTLLQDEKLIRKNSDKSSKTKLYRPLYYIRDFHFQFTDENGDDHYFVRFSDNRLQYEKSAIHAFDPTELTLKQVTGKRMVFDLKKFDQSGEYLHPDFFELEEPFGTWELKGGKVHYLGDLIFTFKTRRIIFGLLSKVEVPDSVRLKKVEIQDNFEETVNRLKKEKPWFPIDNMINLTEPREWIYFEDEEPEESEEPEEPEEPEEKSSEKKEKPADAFY